MDMKNGEQALGFTAEGDSDAAKEILSAVLDKGFDGDLNRLGIVLGRPIDELNQFLSGEETIDDDLVMKMRGIAQQRGIPIN